MSQYRYSLSENRWESTLSAPSPHPSKGATTGATRTRAAGSQSLALTRWLAADAAKRTLENRIAVGGKTPSIKRKIAKASRAIASFEKAMNGELREVEASVVDSETTVTHLGEKNLKRLGRKQKGLEVDRLKKEQAEGESVGQTFS